MYDPIYIPGRAWQKDQSLRQHGRSAHGASVLAAATTGSKKNGKEGRRDDLGRGLHIHEKIKLRLDSGIIETTLDA